MKMKSISHDNSGIALIVVVSVITLLVAVTVQLNRDMRHELTNSTNLMQFAKLSALTKSGYNLAEAILESDSDKYDSQYEQWAELNTTNLSSLTGNGLVEVLISDLSGRFQLNSLVLSDDTPNEKSENVLVELLLTENFGGLSRSEAEEIVNAIIDWIDKNNSDKGPVLTENSYYLSRNPSYQCKNSEIEFVEELLLIRGISSELYYGDGGSTGLKDLVTAHGNDGKININSAHELLLQALDSGIDDEKAADMVSYRDDQENESDLENVNWYKNVSSLSGIDLDTDLITVASNYFSITSTGKLNGMEKSQRSIVFRDAKAGKLEMISTKRL